MHGLSSRFLTTQVSDDHPAKPHPSMVLTAMAELGVEPADTVMIGDTGFDMEMGQAAGVRCLGVTWGYHSSQALRDAGADRLATDFAQVPDLLKELWG